MHSGLFFLRLSNSALRLLLLHFQRSFWLLFLPLLNRLGLCVAIGIILPGRAEGSCQSIGGVCVCVCVYVYVYEYVYAEIKVIAIYVCKCLTCQPAAEVAVG